MAVVNELVTKFTFQGNLKPLGDFQKGLQTSIISLGKIGLAMGAVTAAVGIWANTTLRGAESLVRLSEDTNIAIETLQKMQLITAQNGVTTGVFESSIISLTDKIGEAATQGSDDFNRLGISVRDSEGNIKSTDRILKELTSTFRTLSTQQQINFANKLGIDIKVIKAFNKTNQELKRLTETALKFGVVTEAQTKQLDSYFASIETLKFGFTAIGRQMALNFAPIMERVSNSITDFLANFGGSFSIIFAEFVDGIGNLIGGVDDFISATIGWKPALLAFGVAMSLAFPIIPIVAAVGGILIAIEDLITAFKGGKSVIADFFQDTFDLDIVESLTTAFDSLRNTFNAYIDSLLAGFDIIKETFSGITGLFTGDTNVNTSLTALPIAGGRDNNTTQIMTNDIKIEVKSNDPEAAGVAVSSALSRELEQASFQYGKGGR